MSLTTALEGALKAALGPGVGVAVCRVAEAGTLWPGETLPGAVAARQMEFAAGRTCMRMAMADLGVPAAAVPMGPDRAPVWPVGLTGSLAHGAGLCVAMVARGGEALGVDIEPDAPLPDDVANEVLIGAEAAVPEADRRVIFCAKEAVYKAHYPLLREVWDFAAVTVTLLGGGIAFDARIVANPSSPARRGHVLRQDGVIVTALTFSPVRQGDRVLTDP